jgi:hypothetical protein
VAAGQTVSWGILYYAFAVLVVPMETDLGWSRTVLVGGFTVAVVISGLFAPAVGRHLDHGSPRRVMGTGSLAGAVLILGWSRADSVAAYYVVWAGLGVVMALVLYEPALAVVAKRYAPHHGPALTTVTLVAGTASFIFQPLTSALATERGWRTALVLLAVVLAALTAPLHLGLLPGPPTRRSSADLGRGRERIGVLADRRFWFLSAAFAGASVTSFGTSVLLVAYLVDHGWSLGSGAVAGGTLGIMQLPGRLLLAPLRARLPQRTLTQLMLGLPGFGVLLLLSSAGSPLVWPAVAVLGMSQGLNTLFRITLLVDLYGTERIGALVGLSATPAVLARALAPLGAAVLTGVTGGYTLPFLLMAGIAAAASVLAGRRL